MNWQLQEAKNKFSQVVKEAIENGPQEITRHGKKTVVLISLKDYQKMKHKKGSLVDFFRNSPLSGIQFERSKDLPRNIRL